MHTLVPLNRDYRSRFYSAIESAASEFPELAKIDSPWYVDSIFATVALWLSQEAEKKLGYNKEKSLESLKDLQTAALKMVDSLARIDDSNFSDLLTGEVTRRVDCDILAINKDMKSAISLYGVANITTLQLILLEIAYLSEAAIGGHERSNISVAAANDNGAASPPAEPIEKRGGRPKDETRTNLIDLIQELEINARRYGGHFTLDKKLKKGSLLRALDSLRSALESDSEWSWVAQFIPRPDQHPLAQYERALSTARRKYEARQHIDVLIENDAIGRLEKSPNENGWMWLLYEDPINWGVEFTKETAEMKLREAWVSMGLARLGLQARS